MVLCAPLLDVPPEVIRGRGRLRHFASRPRVAETFQQGEGLLAVSAHVRSLGPGALGAVCSERLKFRQELHEPIGGR